ncbi:energy transducer TonB [Pedobacter glucosidilyticus]|uniref:energy transducer TonB n=1 Tax=Pedobacter glucosidilyticus TaxID=1122941 RepID=UPI00042711A9|nr:energy transducer TonB [Pedobacter glucosidilyticus]
MKLLLTIILLSIVELTQAQEKHNTYYFKKNGKQVQEKDSADYIRTISSPDSGETYHKLVEYYKSGTLKRTGRTSSTKSAMLEGEVTTYYDDGKKEAVKVYAENKLVGPAYEYFRNGELKSYRYFEVPLDRYNMAETNYKLLQMGDSTGRKFLDGEGNGVVETRSENWVSKGPYKGGYKDGLWVLQDLKTQIDYEEVFSKGVLQSGTYKLINGKTGKYTVRETLATFKGGQKALFEFLRNNISYPPEDRIAKVTGRVIVNFVVEADGSLNSFKVIKSPSETLTREAIRVLQKSANWEPATTRGVPVKSSYTLPVIFNLR